MLPLVLLIFPTQLAATVKLPEPREIVPIR